MNHHLRFATCLALAAPLFTSCQSTGDRLLSVSEAVPPKLAKKKPFIHVQCYFFTAPDNFQLLENTKGAHVAGIYSPQDGAKLIKSLQRRKGFDLTSAPALTVRQGTSGRIEVIQEFIYPTEYTPAKMIPNSGASGSFPVTPSTPSKFETKNLGIMADFEGRSSSNGEIDFKVTFERSSFLGFVNYGDPITTTARTAFGKPVDVVLTENRIEQPVFDTRRLSTTLTLTDGHYVALGGLKPPSNFDHLTRKPERGVDPNASRNFFALIKVKAVDAIRQ